MDLSKLTELGAIGIIFIFAVKEFFSYLKSRKNTESNNIDKNVLKVLETMNSNHLNSIECSINDGNDRVVKSITDMHSDLKEILGRIDGKLSK